MSQRSAPSAHASATAVVSEAPRPSVVMSCSSLTPWKPVTITTLPWRSSVEMRSGWISVMRAREKTRVERMPAWAPVSDTAGCCRSCSAMAISVALTVSPVDSSRASSRSSGRVGDLVGELDQLVGGVAHGRDDHDDRPAGRGGARDAHGAPRADALGGRQRRAAVFLDDRPRDAQATTWAPASVNARRRRAPAHVERAARSTSNAAATASACVARRTAPAPTGPRPRRNAPSAPACIAVSRSVAPAGNSGRRYG